MNFYLHPLAKNPKDDFLMLPSQEGMMIFEISKRFKRISKVFNRTELRNKWINIAKSAVKEDHIESLLKSNELMVNLKKYNLIVKESLFYFWKERAAWTHLTKKTLRVAYRNSCIRAKREMPKVYRRERNILWYTFATSIIIKNTMDQCWKYKELMENKEFAKEFLNLWKEGVKVCLKEKEEKRGIWEDLSCKVLDLHQERKIREASFELKQRRKWIHLKRELVYTEYEYAYQNYLLECNWRYLAEQVNHNNDIQNLQDAKNHMVLLDKWQCFTNDLHSNLVHDSLVKEANYLNNKRKFKRLTRKLVKNVYIAKFVSEKLKIDEHRDKQNNKQILSKAINLWHKNAVISRVTMKQLRMMYKSSIAKHLYSVANISAIKIQRCFIRYMDRKEKRRLVLRKFMNAWRSLPRDLILRVSAPKMILTMDKIELHDPQPNIVSLPDINGLTSAHEIILKREYEDKSYIDRIAAETAIEINLEIPAFSKDIGPMSIVNESIQTKEEILAKEQEKINAAKNVVNIDFTDAIPSITKKQNNAFDSLECYEKPPLPVEYLNEIIKEIEVPLENNFIKRSVPKALETELQQFEKPSTEMDYNYLVSNTEINVTDKFANILKQNKTAKELLQFQPLPERFNLKGINSVVSSYIDDEQINQIVEVNANTLNDLKPYAKPNPTFDEEFLRNSTANISLTNTLIPANIEALDNVERIELDFHGVDVPEEAASMIDLDKVFNILATTKDVNIIANLETDKDFPDPLFSLEEVFNIDMKKTIESCIYIKGNCLENISKIEERKQEIDEDFSVDIPIFIPVLGPKLKNIQNYQSYKVYWPSEDQAVSEYTESLEFSDFSDIIPKVHFLGDNSRNEVFELFDEEAEDLSKNSALSFNMDVVYKEIANNKEKEVSKPLQSYETYKKPGFPTFPDFSDIVSLSLDIPVQTKAINSFTQYSRPHQVPKDSECTLDEEFSSFVGNFDFKIPIKLEIFPNNLKYTELLDKQHKDYGYTPNYEMNISKLVEIPQIRFETFEEPSKENDFNEMVSSYDPFTNEEMAFELPEINYTHYEKPHQHPSKEEENDKYEVELSLDNVECDKTSNLLQLQQKEDYQSLLDRNIEDCGTLYDIDFNIDVLLNNDNALLNYNKFEKPEIILPEEQIYELNIPDFIINEYPFVNIEKIPQTPLNENEIREICDEFELNFDLLHEETTKDLERIKPIEKPQEVIEDMDLGIDFCINELGQNIGNSLFALEKVIQTPINEKELKEICKEFVFNFDSLERVQTKAINSLGSKEAPPKLIENMDLGIQLSFDSLTKSTKVNADNLLRATKVQIQQLNDNEIKNICNSFSFDLDSLQKVSTKAFNSFVLEDSLSQYLDNLNVEMILSLDFVSDNVKKCENPLNGLLKTSNTTINEKEIKDICNSFNFDFNSLKGISSLSINNLGPIEIIEEDLDNIELEIPLSYDFLSKKEEKLSPLFNFTSSSSSYNIDKSVIDSYSNSIVPQLFTGINIIPLNHLTFSRVQKELLVEKQIKEMSDVLESTALNFFLGNVKEDIDKEVVGFVNNADCINEIETIKNQMNDVINDLVTSSITMFTDNVVINDNREPQIPHDYSNAFSTFFDNAISSTVSSNVLNIFNLRVDIDKHSIKEKEEEQNVIEEEEINDEDDEYSDEIKVKFEEESYISEEERSESRFYSLEDEINFVFDDEESQSIKDNDIKDELEEGEINFNDISLSEENEITREGNSESIIFSENSSEIHETETYTGSNIAEERISSFIDSAISDIFEDDSQESFSSSVDFYFSEDSVDDSETFEPLINYLGTSFDNLIKRAVAIETIKPFTLTIHDIEAEEVEKKEEESEYDFYDKSSSETDQNSSFIQLDDELSFIVNGLFDEVVESGMENVENVIENVKTKKIKDFIDNSFDEALRRFTFSQIHTTLSDIRIKEPTQKRVTFITNLI